MQKNERELVFLTNNSSWIAQTVAVVYKERGNIEVFFKQIKQNLKIKSFIGTSPNAVMIQVWTAMLSILLLLFLKAKAKFGWNLYNLKVFLRLHLLVKIDLWRWFDDPFFKPTEIPQLVQKKLF